MVNILYNIIVLEPFISFCVTCDHMTMTVTCDECVTVCDTCDGYTIYIIYSLYLIIWDLVEHLKSPEQVSYILFKNAKGRSEQPSASAYVLHLY